ncbi:MAG: hypothetical protein IKQ98_08005 [Erysipelotrichaceae bacterium]|nr:hypothetical protein [Erysipelotrichaceae bacterium]
MILVYDHIRTLIKRRKIKTERARRYDEYRSASILKQLAGDLSSHSETQRKEDLVDASKLKLDDMQ